MSRRNSHTIVQLPLLPTCDAFPDSAKYCGKNTTHRVRVQVGSMRCHTSIGCKRGTSKCALLRALVHRVSTTLNTGVMILEARSRPGPCLLCSVAHRRSPVAVTSGDRHAAASGAGQVAFLQGRALHLHISRRQIERQRRSERHAHHVTSQEHRQTCRRCIVSPTGCVRTRPSTTLTGTSAPIVPVVNASSAA